MKNHISTNQNSLYSQFPQSRNRNSIGRNSNQRTNNSNQFKTAFQLIRIYTVPSYFQGLRTSRILHVQYNFYYNRTCREMSRESRIVSPSFHSVYIHVSPFYFRIGLQMQKGERLLGEREFMLVGCSNTSATILLSLPTDCFLDLDAKYLSAFRAGRTVFKNATFHHLFFIITFCMLYIFFLLLCVFSCTIEKLFMWN